MRAGDYVRCFFPFREERKAGPSPHIVFVLSVKGTPTGRIAVVAYTTTSTKFQGQRRPRQHLFVDEKHALALGQKKPFVIDVMRVARLPITPQFFPDFGKEQRPSGGHDPAALERVSSKIHELRLEGWQLDTVDLTVSFGPKVGR